MKISKKMTAFFCAAALISHINYAKADSGVVVLQPLSFGSFLVRNNNTAAAMTISPAGLVTHDHAFIPINAGKSGIFRLEGFTADSDLSVVISPSSLVMTCACISPDFVMDSFTTFPVTPHTDPAGAVVVNVGATLHTNGNHAAYPESTYSGTLTLHVDY
jgi:hypothetical protein